MELSIFHALYKSILYIPLIFSSINFVRKSKSVEKLNAHEVLFKAGVL